MNKEPARRAGFANSLIFNLHGEDTFSSNPHIKKSNEEPQQRTFNISVMSRFYLMFVAIPMVISLFYASAIFFPPKARAGFSFFLWSDGFLTWQESSDDVTPQQGRFMICPRESICAEGAGEIILLAISRFTAFASYVAMAATFLSKMHSTIHSLSVTFLGTYIPFAHLFNVHKSMGTCFACLSFVHTLGHISRWIIRGDMLLVFDQVGISGVVAASSMLVVTLSVSSWAKSSGWMTFDKRLFAHGCFTILLAAMFFHHTRCRNITLVFVCLWALDRLYGLVYSTHRLDTVHFTLLPNESGIQMLFRNPKGFQANPGEYIKIMIPWLSEGQTEWHPFSIYTQVGLDDVFKDEEMEDKSVKSVQSKTDIEFDSSPALLDEQQERRDDLMLNHNYSITEDEDTSSSLHSLQHSMVTNDDDQRNKENKKRIDPSQRALILIGLQNEVASIGGRLFDDMKDTIDSTGMLDKTRDLADAARSVGTHVFHLPAFNTGNPHEVNDKQSDHTSTVSGFLPKTLSRFFEEDRIEDTFFRLGSWNAEFIDSHLPKRLDSVVTGKRKFDRLGKHNLFAALEKKDIRDIYIGGFMSNSDMDMIKESADGLLDLQIIPLLDGCACTSKKSQRAVFTEQQLPSLGDPITCEEARSLFVSSMPVQRKTPVLKIQRRPSYARLLDKSIHRGSSKYASFLDLKELDTISIDGNDEEIGLNDASLSFIIENALQKLKSCTSTNKGSASLDKTRHVSTGSARDDCHDATGPRSMYLVDGSPNTSSHTTQIFIQPCGDWTKRLYQELSLQAQQSAIWMRGPYVSPYAIATYFSRLVMVASGIGITPALGVLDQYKGFSRFKVLIWFTRCPRMLKFFAPLTTEAHLIIIYYTGKEELNTSEIYRLCKHGNVIIQQSRPASLKNSLSTILATSTNVLYTSDGVVSNTAKDIRRKFSKQTRKKWCIFYCGGSKRLCDELRDYSKHDVGVNFECEMFDY